MTIDQQIAELMAQAEPLRALDPDKAEEAGLGVIVDRINELRAVSAKVEFIEDAVMSFESVGSPGTSAVLIEALPARRKPGPKPKVSE